MWGVLMHQSHYNFFSCHVNEEIHALEHLKISQLQGPDHHQKGSAPQPPRLLCPSNDLPFCNPLDVVIEVAPL